MKEPAGEELIQWLRQPSGGWRKILRVQSCPEVPVPAESRAGTQPCPGPALAPPAEAEAALTLALKVWGLSSQPGTAPAPAPAKLNCFLQSKKSFGE